MIHDGRINTAEGKGSKSAEGVDISRQEHIARLLQIKTPVFSKQFLTAIIEPDELQKELAAPLLQYNMYNRSGISNCTFLAMDLDGLLLYDEDASQIGTSLFEDPLYKPSHDLQKLVEHRIVSKTART